MAGWRTRLAQQVSGELSVARGAARALAQRAAERSADAALAATQALATARRKQATLTATHRRILDSITDRAETDIATAVDELSTVAERLAHGAFGAGWSQWAPEPADRRATAPLLRVGTLAIGATHDPDRRPPALVGLLDRAHLRLTTRAEPALTGVLLRLLGGTEPGAVRLTVYDPERLGGSLAGFAPLAPAGLLTFVGPHGLSEMLDQHVEHIRRINATVLAGDHPDLRALAEATGRRPEPWRILVLLGAHPDDWSKEQRAQLARIRRTGVGCGVHLVSVTDDDIDDTDTVTVSTSGTSATDDVPVSLDPPPPAALLTGTCRMLAERYAAGPQPTRLTDLLPGTFWTESSATGLRVPIGEGTDGRLTELFIGDNPPHALIGGPSGSGKTNLLYAWIGALAGRYHPDELAMYLLDFKEGVSFARFAGGRRSPGWLPHVRLVGVNINDDREFGLALLRYLREELRRRAEAAKRHEVTKLEELRSVDPRGRWPRILAVIDEFQVLLDGRDSVAVEAVELLDDLARRGRSQGIHLVLASQDVSGIEALWLRSSLMAQFTLRIALPKARRLLTEPNAAAEEIPRFHAVVNADSGVASANRIVRLPDAGSREVWDPLQDRLWRDRPGDNRPPRLFDGDHVPVLPADSPDSAGGAPTALVGQAIDLTARPAVLRLARAPGRNLAVIGNRSDEAADILSSVTLSVARRHDVRVTICCADPDSVPAALRLAGAVGNTAAVVDWNENLAAVLAGWESHPADRPHLVVGYAVDAATARLDRADRDRLRELLIAGPERSVHTVGWWRSVPRLREDLGGFAARFDAVDAWVALDVQGGDLAPLSPDPNGPAWYPRRRRALFFDRAVHRRPEVVIPYDTDPILPTVDSILTGSRADEHS